MRGLYWFNAAQMAVGLGAEVTVLDRSAEVLDRVAQGHRHANRYTPPRE